MTLKTADTRWVLFLACAHDPEPRHVQDLQFGLLCLETAGVLPANINIYIDGGDRSTIAGFLSGGSAHSYTIKKTEDFFLDQQSNSHPNLVMFVTGHGGIDGIDASTPIKPYTLLNSIKGTPGLRKAIVYLGQCVAGAFNYIGAGRGTNTAPDVILIGATNLHSSLSLETSEDLLNGRQSWVANVFLLHVFKWILAPSDVDGDGRFTVMDSFKYAGAWSNHANRTYKVVSFVRSFDLHEQYKRALDQHNLLNTPTSQLSLEAAATRYETELLNRYTRQECWILNAIPAQDIDF